MCGCRTEDSAYGICEHVSRGGEHENFARKELSMLDTAGIRWVRTDFDWSGVERKKGEWNYKHLDETVGWAEANGIKVLPILDYDVAWATPAYKHLDEWLEYVRKTVTRYQTSLRYWEVWNEQNGDGMWREKPNPENYVTLLKATYQEIKKIDPELKVLIGGFAGMPFDFIEGVYKAGGKDYFDIMNFHPYRSKSPEAGNLYEDIRKLSALMEKYGDKGKPMWITEVGYPTHRLPVMPEHILKAGLKSVDPKCEGWNAAIISDPEFLEDSDMDDGYFRKLVGETNSFKRIKLEEISSLDAGKNNLLIMNPSESFPADYFDAIEKYLKAGGVLFLWNGVPLYYEKRFKDGVWEQKMADESFRKRLRIGWEAFWTKAGIPNDTNRMEIADEFKDIIPINEKKAGKASRFLNGDALAEGDKFIPIIRVSNGAYNGTAAAVYLLKDKGAVIVSTLNPFFVSEEMQSKYLPRTYLIALQAGVEKVFWYELRAAENDWGYNEDNFGILHKDLSAKPSFISFKALVKARPAGSVNTSTEWRKEGICMMSWKRPDGLAGWAIWTQTAEKDVKLKVEGDIVERFGYMGEELESALRPDTSGILKAKIRNSPIYVIGPGKISLEK
ncbi:MAG: hypothetical protein A2X48_13535 [Lentisphaerae bacterium GWF2_49_21]|nr:MAG: hypothetical protein A2X48_13535 [Lentisphaerae bacterium GWF2_49_21]